MIDAGASSPGVLSDETPGFLTVGGEQVYYVHHRASGARRGGVVIAPPFASERSDAYIACARWARRLVRLGWDAIRFDYRGVGESTGRFERLTLQDRLEDVRTVAGFLRSDLAGSPLILHGMRLGALFAADVFAEGAGDGLLMWAPPASAQDHLWEVLRFTLAAELVQEPGVPRRTRDDCLKEIEAGGTVNVGGYFWKLRLWQSALERPLRVPSEGEVRPWRSVDVRFKVAKTAANDPHRHQVSGGRFWEESTKMTVDISPLVDDGIAWLESKFARGSR